MMPSSSNVGWLFLSQIPISVDSKMGFLDIPKFRIWQRFLKEKYLANMEQQLNSLFYIVETFLVDVDLSEIKNKLELLLS
jgi:hypothetical protein